MTLQLNPATTASIVVTPLYGPGISPSIELVAQDAGGAVAARAAANAANLSAEAAAASETAAEADRIQTGLDRVQTGQDRAQASLDASATAADRVQTGQDRIATAADRVQTGLDRSTASAAATTATTQAGIAVNQAQAADTSAGLAADSADTAVGAASVAVDKAAIATQKATDASNSAQAASTSASTAGTHAQTATTQAGIATTKAGEASASAQTAAAQAGIATTKASEASGSAAAALVSQTSASASAQTATSEAAAAGQSADQASSYAGTALTQANIATSKASEAAASAQTATNQAGTATTKAGEASASATSAHNSQISAAASASAAQAVLDYPDLALIADSIEVLNAADAIHTVAANITDVQNAEENALIAATQAGNSLTSAQTAQTAANNAVAVVTGGTASLTPSAGKIPIADATGQIDSGWVNPLPAVAATLHRSPTPITALFVYDTSKDSDGGAWTEKCQHTSWYQETIYGKWLGAQASESAARAVTGATTNDYYQLTTDGKFYALNAGSGTTEVFRGNKRSFPKMAAIVAEATNVTIYDLTEAGRPMFCRFIATATATITSKYLLSGANALAAINGRIYVGGTGTNLTGLITIDFAKDMARLRTTSGYTWNGNLSTRNTVGGYTTVDAAVGGIANATTNAVATIILPDAPIDPVTGLKVPTIAVGTSAGASVIKHNGTVVSSSSAIPISGVTFNQWVVVFGRFGVAIFYYAMDPGALGSSFAFEFANTIGNFTTSFAQLIRASQGVLVRRQAGGRTISLLKHNEFTVAKSLAASLNETYNTGWLVGDIRRAYLANSKTADRSYKGATATETGTVTSAAVNTGNDLVAYSGFSAANYIREPYSADLDFGTGEWSCSAWVNVPTGNTAAGTAASRAYSSGPYITLGIDATNNLTATAYDGTTTRTVTTPAAYNTATWLKARANYTTDGRLVILVNGVEVAAATGTPLLTLNNSNAVLTIGNSYALDAPFPGSIALLKFSATVPTAEQSQWMYEQEKHLFSARAKCVLPNTSDVRELAYDDATDTWSVAQDTMESTWSGLVRTAMQAPSAGLYSKNAETSGVQLLGRNTTNPGVDVRMPVKNLRTKDMPREINQDIVVFDYLGGFTATTTNGSTSLTSVASSLFPASTNLIGCAISGTGIPASTVITAVSGTTIFMSKAATANGPNIQISTTDFNLPVGYTARAVLTAGTLKREGSTAAFTRLYDGFRETIRYAVAPGYNAWVQIQAVKAVAP